MGRNSGIPWEEIFKEEWRPIPEWLNYQVSDLGRVRHWDGTGWWMVPPHKYGEKGYNVTLSLHQVKKSFRLSNLVCTIFLGERPVGCRVIHIDFDNENNALENLKYADKVEYKAWMGTIMRSHGRTKWHGVLEGRKQRKQARYDKNYQAAQLFLSGTMTQREAAATIGISESALSWWIKRNGVKGESSAG